MTGEDVKLLSEKYNQVGGSGITWGVIAFDGTRGDFEEVIHHESSAQAGTIADWLHQDQEAEQLINDFTSSNEENGEYSPVSSDTYESMGMDASSTQVCVDMGGENGMIIYGNLDLVENAATALIMHEDDPDFDPDAILTDWLQGTPGAVDMRGGDN